MFSTVLSLLQSTDPIVMGVLNVTPDSFSDGGRFLSRSAALAQVHQMIESGVDIIDIGGESSRPGAEPISAEEECERVISLIEYLSRAVDIPISIDTRKTLVMQEAIKAGVSMINDIFALQEEGAIELVAKTGIPVCLMHAKGAPQTMQHSPFYHNVVQEVFDFLKSRVQLCLQAGILQKQIVIDPGFCFGKNLDHNLILLKNLAEFKKLNYPILVGLSRKSMIGAIINAEPKDRLYGSLAAAVIAGLSGATIIRTHDVKATKDALAMVKAMADISYQPIQEEINV